MIAIGQMVRLRDLPRLDMFLAFVPYVRGNTVGIAIHRLI